MSTPSHVGVYPGTFDPVTFGHMDIIKRAAHIVDRLIIAVAASNRKAPLFGLEDRVEMVEREISGLVQSGSKIEVITFDSLLVTFAKEVGATVIFRGLRAVSDFEYEFQMAGTNARLDPDIETVFLMASDRHQFTSSKLVKEVADLNGDISEFVSPRVAEIVSRRLKRG